MDKKNSFVLIAVRNSFQKVSGTDLDPQLQMCLQLLLLHYSQPIDSSNGLNIR
jgi:hypothetical protein